MFYNKKWKFFIIIYVSSLIIYFFIDKQLLIDTAMKGYLSSPLKGSFTIFFLIVFASIVAALIMAILIFFLYKFVMKLIGSQYKKVLFKIWWMLFTIFSYAIIAISFFESIRY
jgi:hypothetical protein